MADLKRQLIQMISAITFNSYIEGFARGTIYRGNLKQVCLPVLNCYSCPGAIGSCPVGSLQAIASLTAYQFSFYVAGFLALVGILVGRLACGWLCPFGLIQELLYYIPSPKIFLPTWTRYIKYLMLAIPVLLLPPLLADSIGIGTPYFCKWLCPAGTLEAAIPLSIADLGIRDSLGWLFTWRVSWLVLILVFIVLVQRGFCQVLCPLGAFYSVFNRISFFTIRYEDRLCNACGKCASACYLRLPEHAGLNHPDCTRCLKCIHKCPTGALSWRVQLLEGGKTIRAKT